MTAAQSALVAAGFAMGFGLAHMLPSPSHPGVTCAEMDELERDSTRVAVQCLDDLHALGEIYPLRCVQPDDAIARWECSYRSGAYEMMFSGVSDE